MVTDGDVAKLFVSNWGIVIWQRHIGGIYRHA